jgi:pyruvate kinase
LVKHIRASSRELNEPVGIIQDLQGPKIRTGKVPGNAPIELLTGHTITIKHANVSSNEIVSTTFPDLHRSVSVGNRILLSDGLIELNVSRVRNKTIECRIIKGGLLGSNQGINLPGVKLKMPSLTDKDRLDLKFGLGLGIDWIALSFVRDAEDVRPIKQILKQYSLQIPILAKIEKLEALNNLPAILKTFDGVMVARGDLGVELPPEDVPIWQKKIIQIARRSGKPSIVATQMLESMLHNPRPTRAETSDVANAVIDGADAVMLSGETAVGSYPVESVSVMARIIEKTEDVYEFGAAASARVSMAHSVTHAACSLADDLGSRAIVVLTRSGATARLVSRSRPITPIIAISKNAMLAKRLSLLWGIQPIESNFPTSTEDALSHIERALIINNLASEGDNVVIVGSTPLASQGRTNFIKVHRITKMDTYA